MIFMPLDEEVKKIVDEADCRCPVCGQKVVTEIKGNTKHGWYLCRKCAFCGWVNDGEKYA
jgi:predicted RNA-binding Zn-ribbon protein involved in translation (DUF1610 family)